MDETSKSILPFRLTTKLLHIFILTEPPEEGWDRGSGARIMLYNFMESLPVLHIVR